MGDTEPLLYADNRGVWREDRPGSPFGIAWDEVHRVSGYKLDGVTNVHVCVELDWEYGEHLELYREWPGFHHVVAAITERLPGLASGWLERVEALGPHDPPIEVWRRA